MTKRELLQSGRAIDVHVCELDELPGYVRKVTFYPEGLHTSLRVAIEYELATLYAARDCEGPCLKYGLRYQDIDQAILDIESYLGIPIERWTNYTKAPITPKVPHDPDPDVSQLYLKRLAERGDLHLPNGSIYRLSVALIYNEEDDPDWVEAQCRLGSACFCNSGIKRL